MRELQQLFRPGQAPGGSQQAPTANKDDQPYLLWRDDFQGPGTDRTAPAAATAAAEPSPDYYEQPIFADDQTTKDGSGSNF